MIFNELVSEKIFRNQEPEGLLVWTAPVEANNEAMRSIEKKKPDLVDVPPKSYYILQSRTLASLIRLIHSWIAVRPLFLLGAIPEIAVGQTNNAGSPIVFSGGNSINISSITAGLIFPSTPDINNPVQILGTGGSLIGSSSLNFLNAFTGSGNLTVNLGGSTSIQLGYT